MLLVSDRSDNHIAPQTKSRGVPRREQRSGDAGLHVISPTTIQPVTLDPRRMRVAHPLNVDRVDVPTHQKSATAPFAARANQHTWATARLLKPLGLKPGITRPALDQSGDFTLTHAPMNERRIHGVSRNERRQQGKEVRAHAAILASRRPASLTGRASGPRQRLTPFARQARLRARPVGS